jgi:hypothetical protein
VQETFDRMDDAVVLAALDVQIDGVDRRYSADGASRMGPLAGPLAGPSGDGAGHAGGNGGGAHLSVDKILRRYKATGSGVQSSDGSGVEQDDSDYGDAGAGFDLGRCGTLSAMKVQVEEARLARAVAYLQQREVAADDFEKAQLSIWRRACTRVEAGQQ